MHRLSGARPIAGWGTALLSPAPRLVVWGLISTIASVCALPGCAAEQCRTEALPVESPRGTAPLAPIECPADMAAVDDSFCVDRYEASRPDATATDCGADQSHATSRKGVMPWMIGNDNSEARAACVAAGKDLCSEMQWSLACEGSAKTTYGYGNTYEPETCNGLDLFGRGFHHLLPTGELEDCRSDHGVCDINGNLWEHVLGGNSTTVRGGAYNCKDSKRLHRCDYIPVSWTPLALGFRCCLVPERTHPPQ